MVKVNLFFSEALLAEPLLTCCEFVSLSLWLVGDLASWLSLTANALFLSFDLCLIFLNAIDSSSISIPDRASEFSERLGLGGFLANSSRRRSL